MDSLSTSIGLGFSVLAAARAAAAGKQLDEVVAVAEDLRSRTHLLFAVETLEYLHRGGRIGAAKRPLGTALNIKPLLHLENGSVEPLMQVRPKRKTVSQMLTIAEQRLAGKPIAEAAIMNADCPEEAAAVAEQVKERFGLSTVRCAPLSPVIGAHAGPGTVGICFYS